LCEQKKLKITNTLIIPALDHAFDLNGNVIFKALGFMPAAGPIKNK
jgi:hypothetical protein